MLCNWYTTANVFFCKSIVKRNKILFARPLPIIAPHHQGPSIFRSVHSCRVALGPSVATKPTSNPQQYPILSPSNTSHTDAVDHLHVPADLTPAKLSRASAAAIRVSLNGQALWDAFHLWNSLRWSRNQYSPTPGFRYTKPTARFMPIDFGQAVPSQLAGHTLIHGLIRAGETRIAAKLAHQMQEDGLELRRKTFESLLQALHPSNVVPGEDRTVYDRTKSDASLKSVLKDETVLDIRYVMPADPLTAFTVRLLRGARQHRWQRTQSMYDTAISACLMQGEIIVASLLLAILFQEFSLGRAASQQARSEVSDDRSAKEVSVHLPRRGHRLLPTKLPYLSFQETIRFIGEQRSRDVDDPLFQDSTQALANLAALLDARELPMKHLSSLIKLLYSYPRNDLEVWIKLRGGEPRSYNAYLYFNAVLVRLCRNLPTEVPREGSRPSFHLRLPALDLESYNALLNYSLTRRHSLQLADRITTHMVSQRRPPLSPSIVTYNIFLRGSTLMRRNDISKKVLEALARNMSPEDRRASLLSFGKHHDSSSKRDAYGISAAKKTAIDRGVRRIQMGNTAIPDADTRISASPHSLVAYIKYLVVTNRSAAVGDILFNLIPELVSVDHPEWGELPGEVRDRLRRQQRRQSREGSVKAAVGYGPHFFAAVLHALCKAGKTGLAERVWTLAKAAEQASWDTPNPWCLSIHAYTSMLQVYASEARKGLQMVPSKPTALAMRWQPTSATKANAVGWAHFILSNQVWRSSDRRRSPMGMRMGHRLYLSMQLGSQSIYESLQLLQAEGRPLPKKLEPPVPDERFFNAALDVFGRRAGIHTRRTYATRAYWRRRLRRAQRRFLDTGAQSHHWSAKVEQIALDMHAAGYSIPAGFQEMFVGRWETRDPAGDAVLVRRKDPPFSFGRRGRARFLPHRVQTLKTKGLPVKRLPVDSQKSRSCSDSSVI
ncbi:hypothetical protein BV25DRAFT_119063 [Artomyces pyxidatus]|uniref:Uncharacterized protein n=1 Tax=Artomyces pyxidatus TaxID=48021 RepID=A0ACB8TLI3_9AGAM|nr:hypothetical protein BV25DRAFT_119063 [Artomyces pyxidatus]